MLVLEQENQELYDRVQEKNLIRQYDLLTNCIEIGLQFDHTAFDKYMIWALNHVAVAHISQFGGRFRKEPIYVGSHIPPHFEKVPELMDRFISFVHENWYICTPTELAAYALWRMNWIHPFIKEDRDGYEAALTAADQAWDQGQLDFSKMEEYLAALVQAQLADEGVPNPGPVT